MGVFSKKYDVIIAGAGLSGIHAAKIIAARNSVLLLTSSWDTVAKPAWGPVFRSGPYRGGTEKENEWINRLVAESETGRYQYGRATFISIDPYAYQRKWKHLLERTGRLTVFQDTVEDFDQIEKGWAVRTKWGAEFSGRTLIIAAGTFLGGTVRIGRTARAAGRPGETGAADLDGVCAGLGIRLTEETWSFPPTFSDVGAARVRLTGNKNKLRLAPLDKDGRQLYPHRLDGRKVSAEAIEEIGKSAKEISPAYSVTYMKLEKGQLTPSKEQKILPGLYFIGRVAGAKDYKESIETAIAAGNAIRGVSRET